MERANVGGSTLEYDDSGSGEPVVLIHGALIADTFRHLLTEPRLLDSYRLIHYHRRGYAGSSRVTGIVGVGQQAADCQALLRHLGVERAHVVGHSYGGAVALQMALDAPSQVRSLTLLEPALMLGSSAEGYRESLRRSSERYGEAGAAVVVSEFLQARWPNCHLELEDALPGAFEQAVADAGTSFDCELPGLLDWRFGEAEAGRIGQPTLCVLGGESAALSPRFAETHRHLLAWLPRAEGLVLPGATHFLQVQQPRALADALAAFLSRQ